MQMSERLVLCNMVIDFGAKTGYIQPDEDHRALPSLSARPGRAWTGPHTDSNRDYGRIVRSRRVGD